jgi:hypothetical protein
LLKVLRASRPEWGDGFGRIEVCFEFVACFVHKALERQLEHSWTTSVGVLEHVPDNYLHDFHVKARQLCSVALVEDPGCEASSYMCNVRAGNHLSHQQLELCEPPSWSKVSKG